MYPFFSMSMSYATFRIQRHMTTQAIDSSTGTPSLAPPMPISEPTDDSASER